MSLHTVSDVSANNASNVMRRVLVGLLLAAVGLTLVANQWAFDALVLVLGLIMLYELNALCEIKGQPLEYPVAIFGVVAYIVLAWFDMLHRWEGVLLAAVTIASFSIGMYSADEKGYFARTAYTLLAVLYIGKLLTYFVFLRSIPVTGIWWTYDVVVLIALTDICAMVVGSLIGRHQLTQDLAEENRRRRGRCVRHREHRRGRSSGVRAAVASAMVARSRARCDDRDRRTGGRPG